MVTCMWAYVCIYEARKIVLSTTLALMVNTGQVGPYSHVASFLEVGDGSTGDKEYVCKQQQAKSEKTASSTMKKRNLVIGETMRI